VSKWAIDGNEINNKGEIVSLCLLPGFQSRSYLLQVETLHVLHLHTFCSKMISFADSLRLGRIS